MSNCSSYTSAANSYMDTLDSLTNTLNTPYSTFSTSMTDAFTSYATVGVGDTVDNIIGSLGSYANQQLAEATSAAEDATGNNECLNAIINTVSSGLSNIVGYGESLISGTVDSLLDDVSGSLLVSIPGLSEFVSAFNSSGIPDIIAAADQIINCIDSSSCGTASEIDSMIDKIDSFTSAFGLDIHGNFDLSSWLTNTVSNISNLGDKLDGFVTKIGDLFTGYGSWQTTFSSDLEGFMSSYVGSSITGTYGEAFGYFGSASAVDFASTGLSIGTDTDTAAGETTGTKAEPIKHGECDSWDKTKQLS